MAGKSTKRFLTKDETSALKDQVRDVLADLPTFKPGPEKVMPLSELENYRWVGEDDPRTQPKRARGRPALGEAFTPSTVDSYEAATWVLWQMHDYRQRLGKPRVPELVRDRFVEIAMNEAKFMWPEARITTIRENLRKRSSAMTKGMEAAER